MSILCTCNVWIILTQVQGHTVGAASSSVSSPSSHLHEWLSEVKRSPSSGSCAAGRHISSTPMDTANYSVEPIKHEGHELTSKG